MRTTNTQESGGVPAPGRRDVHSGLSASQHGVFLQTLGQDHGALRSSTLKAANKTHVRSANWLYLALFEEAPMSLFHAFWGHTEIIVLLLGACQSQQLGASLQPFNLNKLTGQLMSSALFSAVVCFRSLPRKRSPVLGRFHRDKDVPELRRPSPASRGPAPRLAHLKCSPRVRRSVSAFSPKEGLEVVIRACLGSLPLPSLPRSPQ